MMDWFDVADILYDGTIAEVKAVRCPTCNGEIEYSFKRTSRADIFTYGCRKCGHIEKDYKCPIPNFMNH